MSRRGSRQYAELHEADDILDSIRDASPEEWSKARRLIATEAPDVAHYLGSEA